MSEYRQLSREEGIQKFLGSKHKVDIWAAVLEYDIEPPETFRLQDIHNKMSTNGSNIARSLVWKELKFLSILGMIEETSRDNYREVPFNRIESPGWEIAAKAVEVIDVWFPNSVKI